MRLVNDRPRALTGNFVLLGTLSDTLKSYACILDISAGKIHVEEIWWSGNVKGNEATASLRAIDDDREWALVYGFVTQKTTIMSPKKLREAIMTAGHRNVKQLNVIKTEDYPYVKREVDLSKPLHRIKFQYKNPNAGQE